MPSTLKSTLPKIPPWRAEARYTPFRQLVFLKRNIHMRVIKEHKEIILKYLMSALDYSYIDNKNFIIKYKLIVDQMNNIFMRFIKNNILGVNQDIELIDSIRKLNYKEADLLGRYLKYCGI